MKCTGSDYIFSLLQDLEKGTDTLNITGLPQLQFQTYNYIARRMAKYCERNT